MRATFKKNKLKGCQLTFVTQTLVGVLLTVVLSLLESVTRILSFDEPPDDISPPPLLKFTKGKSLSFHLEKVQTTHKAVIMRSTLATLGQYMVILLFVINMRTMFNCSELTQQPRVQRTSLVSILRRSEAIFLLGLRLSEHKNSEGRIG